MVDAVAVGRRERKKAATRAAILDAATALFLERGFDAVTVREIADRADVSPKTVFTHFPHKEALVFSDEDDRHERLVTAVSGRAPGTTISDSLRAHYLAEIAALHSEPQRQILALMDATPALVDYAEKMWFRHEDALVAAITEEFGLTEPSDEIRFYVRFALHIQLSATRESDPAAAIDAGFSLLDDGWTRYRKAHANSARPGRTTGRAETRSGRVGPDLEQAHRAGTVAVQHHPQPRV
jgi:AcrR family transcriptional regulator